MFPLIAVQSYEVFLDYANFSAIFLKKSAREYLWENILGELTDSDGGGIKSLFKNYC